MNNAIVSMAAVAMAAVGATNVINRQRTTVHVSAHDMAAVVFIIVTAAVLMALPAQAQDIGGASASDALYLPAVSWTFPMWFTDAELQQAQRDAGYGIEAQMHTVCTLDASATPPHDLRYSSCEQFWVDGQPTEGTGHYIWWLRLNDGKVHGVEVGGTMVSASGDDAPCYTEDDGEVACG